MFKTVHRIANVKAGDIVTYECINCTPDGIPAFENGVTRSAGTVVLDKGKLVIDGTYIRVDRMVYAPVGDNQVCVVFLKAERPVYGDEIDEGWTDNVPKKQSIKFYVNAKGRVWYCTADNRWICIAASRGQVMSSTIKKNVNSLVHAPKSELPFKEVEVDFMKLFEENS